MSTETVTVHVALARALKELNVRSLFGLMGDSNLFLVDAFVRQFEGRYVPANHEAAAVMMGLGYAVMTDEVGVVTITQGPALSNALTPIIDGKKGMVPLVLLCGDTSRKDPDHPQTVEQQALIHASGAGCAHIRSPETAVQDMVTAFRRARFERRPIVLNMPTELMWETTQYSGIGVVPQPTKLAPEDGKA